MTDILTSLHGRKIGLTANSRLVINHGTGLQQMMDSVVGNATAASSAVTTTTSETLFNNSITITPGILIAGSLIRIRYQGIVTAVNSTDTVALKLYIGGLTGTALISHAATNCAASSVFQGEFELAIRTSGASGTMVGCGTYKSIPAAAGTATYKDAILASTAIDTTASQVIGASATWSTNNAGNSCRLDFLRVSMS